MQLKTHRKQITRDIHKYQNQSLASRKPKTFSNLAPLNHEISYLNGKNNKNISEQAVKLIREIGYVATKIHYLIHKLNSVWQNEN